MNIKRIKGGIERRIFGAKKRLFRLRLAISKTPRPSSYPYISADSFRTTANHVFDFVDERSLAPAVRNGDIVYVNSDDLEKFFKLIHPKIDAKYVLLSHWGIKPADESLFCFIDGKIIHWFAKNALARHPKITPIPIGLEDLHRYNAGIPSEFDGLRRESVGKKEKILYDFKVATNPKERARAESFLADFRPAERLSGKLPAYEYHRLLREYMFVASPPGAGRECHRTWEGIYLDTVPIVLRSIAEEHFRDSGVPMWIVDDWRELEGVNLKKKYEEIMSGRNKQAIWMDYWTDKIQKTKHL